MILLRRDKLLTAVLILLILTGITGIPVQAESPVGITVATHIENIGWNTDQELNNSLILGTTGAHLKLEAIRFSSQAPDQFTLAAQAHIENIGWVEPVGNGQDCGTTGQNKGIEAIKIFPQGSLSEGKKVYYRAHVENYGWTNWGEAGNIVGTTGLNSQLEAIQIKIYDATETPSLEEGNVNWSSKDKSELLREQNEAVRNKKNVDYSEVLTTTGIYKHNSESFIEGFFFNNGRLFETGGTYGKSAVYKNVDLNTGRCEIKTNINRKYFAEGCCILNGKLYVLTYKERQVLVYNPETVGLMEIKTYHDREGWGLTTDGNQLIASDGSAHIYFMDENLNDLRTITVTDNGVPVKNLNELEYIDGYIWANVWRTRDIVVINKDSGEVVKRINCTNLYTGPGEVMNGIAYNPDSHKLYLTGKWWIQTIEFDIKPYTIY